MFQGAGTPHYPYGPPHQPGFNDNNAMNGQPPFHPYGPPRQPGFNGNNGSNATNGQSSGFGNGQSSDFGTGQSPGFGTGQCPGNAANGQFGVLDRRTMMPALLPRGNVQTDHFQSGEINLKEGLLRSSFEPTTCCLLLLSFQATTTFSLLSSRPTTSCLLVLSFQATTFSLSKLRVRTTRSSHPARNQTRVSLRLSIENNSRNPLPPAS
jgi:hypothetical protein